MVIIILITLHGMLHFVFLNEHCEPISFFLLVIVPYGYLEERKEKLPV